MKKFPKFKLVHEYNKPISIREAKRKTFYIKEKIWGLPFYTQLFEFRKSWGWVVNFETKKECYDYLLENCNWKLKTNSMKFILE